MLVYILLYSTLFLSAWSIVSLHRYLRKELACSWHGVLAAVALGIFIYLYGTWVYLSIYAKYVHGIILLLVFAAGMVKRKRPSEHSWRIVPNIFFTFLLGSLSMLYFTGTTGKPETVELSFPLKQGHYFVLQGGKGLPSNFFHYSYRGAVYAMDLVRLDARGNRASHIFSDRLEDYHIYNDTVYSPCEGRILRARDENPDNIPPSRKRGPSNTNQVLIQTDSFYVFLAHLKYKGVFVHEGDSVYRGEPLGLVGNSGFSLEPHLHIQVHKNTGGEKPWHTERPLYIRFDGRAYLLFEQITKFKPGIRD